MWRNPQIPADLVTFTEKIFNGKHFLKHFLCSVSVLTHFMQLINFSVPLKNIKNLCFCVFRGCRKRRSIKRSNIFKIDGIYHGTDFYVIVYVQLIVMAARFRFSWVAISTVFFIVSWKNLWNTYWYQEYLNYFKIYLTEIIL